MRKMLVILTMLYSIVFMFSTTCSAEDNLSEKQGTFITNADERFIPLSFQKSLKEDVERSSSGVLSLQSVDTITDKVIEEKWNEVLERETEYKSFKMLILYSEAEDRVFLKTQDNQVVTDKEINALIGQLDGPVRLKPAIQSCVNIYSKEYSFNEPEDSFFNVGKQPESYSLVGSDIRHSTMIMIMTMVESAVMVALIVTISRV